MSDAQETTDNAAKSYAVLTRGVTPTEIAALTAVIAQTLEEESQRSEQARTEPVSRWHRNRRNFRKIP